MQAEIIPVTVTYTNGQFSYIPDQQDVVAQLPPGNCVLVFTLSGDPGISWPSNFITWTADQPDSLTELPMVASGNLAVLGIVNDVSSQCRYDFRVTIELASGETVTSPDPDIVLDPP